ncbi:MAG: DNA-3-methyladenine glycosylase [Smithella sp.]
MDILDRKFYGRDTLKVARALLGKKLVRQTGHIRYSGIIVETEAYCGMDDSACHAHRGETPRNSVMFGKPGCAYVYFTYGIHYMLNLVTEDEGSPCAVLIRAILPLTGIEEMESHRKRKGSELTNGPAKVCQALEIDKSLNGWDVTRGSKLWVEGYRSIPDSLIETTTRIGIDYSNKKDREALWRFMLQKNNQKGFL